MVKNKKKVNVNTFAKQTEKKLNLLDKFLDAIQSGRYAADTYVLVNCESIA